MSKAPAAGYRTTFFDDLVIGEVRTSDKASASEGEMIAFAREFDNQYYHVDPEAAKASPFGGLIASGAHTFALWNKLHLTVHSDIAWICGLAFEDMKFAKALRPDMAVYARSELLEKRLSRSDPGRGIAIHRFELLDADDEPVLTFECSSLVERRPED